MPNYTANYWYIEVALDAHAKSFAALEARMDAFRPLPFEAFEDEWQRMWHQMRPINEDMSDEALKCFIDAQIAMGRSEQMQYTNAFMEPFAAEAISITVLSHALVEATINAVLALGLEISQKTQLFVLLERADVKHKWTFGPQAFQPSYRLPKSIALYGDLAALCRRRNAYVHSKITLRDAAQQILLPGSPDAALSIGKESRKLMRRFLALPYDLHQQLLQQIEDRSLRRQLALVLTPQQADLA